MCVAISKDDPSLWKTVDCAEDQKQFVCQQGRNSSLLYRMTNICISYKKTNETTELSKFLGGSQFPHCATPIAKIWEKDFTALDARCLIMSLSRPTVLTVALMLVLRPSSVVVVFDVMYCGPWLNGAS